MKLKELFKKYEGDESQWISMSDMMTGLMVIFLLLFVISTIAKTQLEDDINKTDQDVRAWIKDYGLLENDYNALKATHAELEGKFRKYQILTAKRIDPEDYEKIKRELKSTQMDLDQVRTEKDSLHAKMLEKREQLITELKNIWTTEEKKRLAIEVLDTGAIHLNRGQFNTGSSEILPPLRRTLEEMMPKLVEYIKENKHLIERIEIVGHASPEWPECRPFSFSDQKGKNLAHKYGGDVEKCEYFENMVLSQERSHSVLLEIDNILTGFFAPDEFELIKDVFFANGRSSSDRKTTYEKSRRATLYMHYNLAEISSYVVGQKR